MRPSTKHATRLTAWFHLRRHVALRLVAAVATAFVPFVSGGVHGAEPAAESAAAGPFVEAFDAAPGGAWKWLREDKATWRIADGGLEIRVLPGLAENSTNALVRPAPDRAAGRYAIEVTVTNHTVPTHQYEQAGITWYVDGKPAFKLVKERVDGTLRIIPGHKPMDAKTVRLRLVVEGNRWTALYRPEGATEFQTAATGDLPPPKNDEVSIQCYQGPDDAEHWIRFDDFRIEKLDPAPQP